MIWVFVFAGLALAGFIALAVYVAVPLRQKIDGTRAEVLVLTERVEQIRELVGRLELDRLRRH